MIIKKNRQDIHGVLLLNKPLSISSNSALQRVKRLFNAKKAGHTGSLDPLATGMLPICLGEATKFSQFLLDSDKRYRVTMKLGVKTSTGDVEGEVIATHEKQRVTATEFINAAQKFLGDILQVPPMFSALKHKGKPLYELARQGVEVERAARSVHIYEIQLNEIMADEISFDVCCSKGTYVRTLVEDLAEFLGTVAHVIYLHRLAVAAYEGSPMYTLEFLEQTLQAQGVDGLLGLLLSPDTALKKLPEIIISTELAHNLRQGQRVKAACSSSNKLVKILTEEGLFLGIGEVHDDGILAPKRLIVMPSSF